jgi:tetratricopeptide (TPR) repeat protein
LKHAFVAHHCILAWSFIGAFGVGLFGVPSCSTVGVAGIALDRVDRLVAGRQFSEALPLALDNRERYPNSAAAAWQLARVYQGLGAPGDEAAAWEAYLQTSPPTGEVCLSLSDDYHQLGRPRQVIATVNRCLALDDRQPELLGDASAAYLEVGDRLAAVAALERALAIDPTGREFREALEKIRHATP